MKFNEFRKKFSALFLTLCSSLHLGCSAFGIQREEGPKYEIIRSEKNKEIRRYQSHLVAQTTVDGSFDEAQNKGFRILADYIFGKNRSQQKIAMTSPVVQKPEELNEKIAMTAPVVMTPNSNRQQWTMTFSMPSQYTTETLPQPLDERVKIVTVPEKYIGVIEFAGFWSEKKNAAQAKSLQEWLSSQAEYEMNSEPQFAGYNPPWTIPWFRRNEMMVELKKKN